MARTRYNEHERKRNTQTQKKVKTNGAKKHNRYHNNGYPWRNI